MMLVGLPGALEQVIHVRKQWRTALPVFTTPILCFLCWKEILHFFAASVVSCVANRVSTDMELSSL